MPFCSMILFYDNIVLMYCYLLFAQVKIRFFVRGSDNTPLKGLIG
jgi:hypothetical protein